MNNIDKRELLGVQKHANQHRLSRLTMEVYTDELRIMASAVESYTDDLIAALEAAEKRVAELEAREVTLPERYDIEMQPLHAPYGEWYSREDILASLRTAGIRIHGED